MSIVAIIMTALLSLLVAIRCSPLQRRPKPERRGGAGGGASMSKATMILKLVAVLLWAATLNNVLIAQHHDNIWLMSDLNGGVQIDFRSGTPEVNAVDIPIVMHSASATMSNGDGNLAFYTNGCQIYSANHTLMENGAGINPGEIHDDYCFQDDWGYPTAVAAVVVVPRPNYNQEYIMIHKPIDYEYNANGQITGLGNYGMYYSAIDMNANEGNGSVVDKNVLIDGDSFEAGAISLTKHANGEDWWLVTPLVRSNEYAIFLIDSDGIHIHGYHTDGIADTGATEGGGQSRFNVAGSQYLRFNITDGLQYWDFDRQTGTLSNYRHVPLAPEYQFDLITTAGGVATSPSGQFAYVTNHDAIIQYDLTSSNVYDSGIKVGEVFNYDSLFIPPSVYTLQLGPDCKIYAFANSADNHHVIHAPDEPGLACDFEQGYLQLPYPVFRDHPYFPNYRLGPLDDPGSPCAGPLVGVEEAAPQEDEPGVVVYPNPVADLLYVSSPNPLRSLELFNHLGQSLRFRSFAGIQEPRLSLNVQGLPVGMYTLLVTTTDNAVETLKIVVQ